MDHSETFLLAELFCGTPPSCLKVMGWVVVGGGGGGGGGGGVWCVVGGVWCGDAL